MTTFRCTELVDLFADNDQAIRTAALTVLCDSYATDEIILPGILRAWDSFGADKAFADFAMLSYVPAQAALLPEVCQRAKQMVEGRTLTDPITRAAGKLIEQQMQLTAAELQPHLELLRDTVAKSKIFFRVDLGLQSQRIELLGLSADQIAAHLESAIAACVANDKDDAARMKAIISLEALRRQHPQYIDLGVALAGPPKEGGAGWTSFSVTLQSLIQFSQDGLEEHIGQHLLDHREFVYSMAVEALVRCGTVKAAEQLLTRFDDANSRAQHWIARGLQRVRGENIASRIAHLVTLDSHLKASLLLAQIRQLDAGFDQLAKQLEKPITLPIGSTPLLQLGQRLLPQSDAIQSALSKLIGSSSSTNDSAQKAAAAEKREAIRDALRRQMRNVE